MALLALAMPWDLTQVLLLQKEETQGQPCARDPCLLLRLGAQGPCVTDCEHCLLMLSLHFLQQKGTRYELISLLNIRP